jgi:RNAse (barnase) inhibitor barstar
MNFPTIVQFEIFYFLEWEEFYKILEYYGYDIQKQLKIYSKYNNSLDSLSIWDVFRHETEYLEVFIYLYSIGNLCGYYAKFNAMELAGQKCYLKIVKYIYFKIWGKLNYAHTDCIYEVVNWASIHGDLKVIIYVCENIFIYFKDIPIINKNATYYIHTGCKDENIDKIVYVFNDKYLINIVKLASEYGNLDIVKYVFETIWNKHINAVIYHASFYGHLDIIQYIYSFLNNCIVISNAKAKKNGHIDVVEYFRSMKKNKRYVSKHFVQV